MSRGAWWALPLLFVAQASMAAGQSAVAVAAVGPDGPPSAAVRAASWDTVVAVIGRTWIDRAFIAERWIPEATRRRTAAVASADDTDFRRAMFELLGLVPASHFYVIPASAFDSSAGSTARGTIGLELRFAHRAGETALVVSHVAEGSPAARAALRVGTEITAIGEREIATRLRAADSSSVDATRHRARSRLLQQANAAVAPDAGDSLVLLVRAPGESHARRVLLTAVTDTSPTASFGNLPPLSTRVHATHAPLRDGRTAGVIGWDVWLPAIIPLLDAAFAAAKGCDGLVIDLRGNLGGAVGMVMGIGGHLLDTTAVLATLTSRDAVLRLAANPRRVLADGTRTTPYAGPLAILVDLPTASTSEIFAGALSELGRARLFGERTAGQALPALTARLANGDVLVHATADLTGPAGRRFDGVGITPHVLVPLDDEVMAAGRDAVLEAALAWLTTQPSTAALAARACIP